MPYTYSSDNPTLPTSKSRSKSLAYSRSATSMRSSLRSSLRSRYSRPQSSVRSASFMEERRLSMEFREVAQKSSEFAENGIDMLKFQQQLRSMDWGSRDLKDLSFQPSYSEYEIPYYALCLIRYREARIKYEKQFQWEIKNLLAQQSTAYDETLLGRPFYITSLWPPLHSRREMKSTHKKCFNLTDKERRRIQHLMVTKIV